MLFNTSVHLIHIVLICILIPMSAWTAGNEQNRQPKGPPPEIVEACRGLSENASCQVDTPDGVFQGVCVEIREHSACVLRKQDASPEMQSRWETLDRNHDGFLDVNEIRPGRNRHPKRRDPEDMGRDDRRRSGRREKRTPKPHASGGQGYSITQAVSDKAQLNTIAFNGLAFLTGDFESDTFLPPGKVSDYFGFQYMRDIDAGKEGHNTSFLTRIANNVLAILNDDQKAQLMALAEAQEDNIRRFAEMRFPLIKAFRRNLEGDFPSGCNNLNKNVVMSYSADLYALDGLLAFQRARVMADILRGLDSRQKADLSRLAFGDSRTWPDLPEQLDRRSMSHTVQRGRDDLCRRHILLVCRIRGG